MSIQEILPSILALAGLLAMSAYFSATETAFSAASRTRLRSLADQGDRRAELACRLSQRYDALLSAILIGNNIVNIAVASISTVLMIGLLGPELGATAATAGATVVVLIFGEITPKSLAKDHAEGFARFSAPILRVLMGVLSPLTWLFGQWKKLVSRLVRSRGPQAMTQEELLLLVDEVRQEGAIDEEESRLLTSAITFGERTAEDILTHRIDLCGISKDAGNEEAARSFAATGHSRLLVYGTGPDDVVGVLHQKDLFDGPVLSDRPLTALMKPPLFVARSMPISDLLRLLQSRHCHLAVVNDGYGGTLGVVTVEDILEELVGEIWDEHDEAREDVLPLENGGWRILGGAPLEPTLAQLGLTPEGESATVGGWVMEHLERVPREGEQFAWGGFRFTVTRADRRRVWEIRAEPAPESVQEGETAHTG